MLHKYRTSPTQITRLLPTRMPLSLSASTRRCRRQLCATCCCPLQDMQKPPASCTPTGPGPPPAYQRALTTRGPALHIDALTLVTRLHLAVQQAPRRCPPALARRTGRWGPCGPARRPPPRVAAEAGSRGSRRRSGAAVAAGRWSGSASGRGPGRAPCRSPAHERLHEGVRGGSVRIRLVVHVVLRSCSHRCFRPFSWSDPR